MSPGFISFWWQRTCGSAAMQSFTLSETLLRASATSMTCANLLLNSNTVFLSKQKSFPKDVFVFLVQSRFHTTVFTETWYDHPVLTLIKHIHTQMPDRMRDQVHQILASLPAEIQIQILCLNAPSWSTASTILFRQKKNLAGPPFWNGSSF